MADTQNQLPQSRPSLLEWEVMDRPRHNRTFFWYLMAGTLALGLLIYSIVTTNFLFAIMILLLAFIVVIQEIVPPKPMMVRLTSSGIWIGESHYLWYEFTGFYIIYQPPQIERLYLEFDAPKTDLNIDITGQDPLVIREVMLRLLPENVQKDEETTTDTLRRVLKI